METLVLIILAISLHYALDYLGDVNKIDCPDYCEVDHEHTIRIKEFDEISKEESGEEESKTKKEN